MTDLSRRQVLARIGLGTAAVVIPSKLYLDDEEMFYAPGRGNKIIADLHSHPANYKGDEETLEMLCSPGIVGLTYINNGRKNRILTYEQVLSRFSGLVEEVDKGNFARIKGTSGYVMRTQEITGGTHHILAVGWEGNDYFPNYKDARKAVDEIHKKDGIAVLCHPYATPDRKAKIVKYRFLNIQEEEKMNELCEMVNEIEIFNAQCINPTLGIVVPNMKTANDLAERLALDCCFKGIVNTDAHLRLEQSKICGIHVDEKGLCAEKLKADISSKNFDNDYRKYVSRWSFAMGMFVG